MAQKLFTAKLDEEDIDRLRAIAGGRPMAEVVRAWIRGGQAVYTAPDGTGTLGLDTLVDSPVDTVDASTAHQACDTRIAELEAAVAFHRGRYEPLLGACEAVYAACGRQGDLHQYTLYRDVVDRVREVVDEEVPL